jgi:D-inositol-3-phosphate glycosyltransferase
MKILFYATHYSQPIGYGRVAHKLVNFLASLGHDVHYFAITNYEQANHTDRLISPSINVIDVVKENKNDPYGFELIKQTLLDVKPDVFFIYNDVVVICNILNQIVSIEKTFKLITYLDLVFDYERYNYIDYINSRVDRILVFSDHWKKNLININVSDEKIYVLPHGIDDCFVPIDKQECRRQLSLSQDDFIILNTNRNSYRKALDITIKAFLVFLKNNHFKSGIKLYLNCNLNTVNGYDIQELTKTECIKLGIDYKLVLNNHVFKYHSNEGGITDKELNKLYCASDVGVNTCVGEGFGLCNLEHLSLGVPQITTEVGGLIDFIPVEMRVKPKVILSAPNLLDEHNGDLSICDHLDFASRIQMIYDESLQAQIDTVSLREKYNWDVILKDFKEMIDI